jgi:hypothetical protein
MQGAACGEAAQPSVNCGPISKSCGVDPQRVPPEAGGRSVFWRCGHPGTVCCMDSSRQQPWPCTALCPPGGCRWCRDIPSVLRPRHHAMRDGCRLWTPHNRTCRTFEHAHLLATRHASAHLFMAWCTWCCCRPSPRCAHQAFIHKGSMYIWGGEFSSPNQERFMHFRWGTVGQERGPWPGKDGPRGRGQKATGQGIGDACAADDCCGFASSASATTATDTRDSIQPSVPLPLHVPLHASAYPPSGHCCRPSPCPAAGTCGAWTWQAMNGTSCR